MASNSSSAVARWIDGPWAPVVRFGTVLEASSRVLANEAYELGEIAYSQPSKVLAPLVSPAMHKHLSKLGITSIQPAEGDLGSVGYQLKPTIILNYAPILFKGPMQFGKTRTTNFVCRISLTICPDNTRSKLWLRFTPTDHFSIDACQAFFTAMREFEAILREAILSSYNSAIASKVGKQYTRYFSIPIGICASLDKGIGKTIREEVMFDRTAATHRSDIPDPRHGLDKDARSVIGRLGRLSDEQKAPKAQKYLTSLYYRQLDGSPPAETDRAEAPIYVVCSLSVYNAAAELLGLAFDPAGLSDKDRELAALIASAELSMELGAAY